MEKKDAYRQKMEAWYDQQQARLAGMRGRLKEKSADAQIELRRTMDKAESKLDQFGQQLSKMKDEAADNSSDIWKTMKAQTEEVLDEVDQSMRKIEDSVSRNG